MLECISTVSRLIFYIRKSPPWQTDDTDSKIKSNIYDINSKVNVTRENTKKLKAFSEYNLFLLNVDIK